MPEVLLVHHALGLTPGICACTDGLPGARVPDDAAAAERATPRAIEPLADLP